MSIEVVCLLVVAGVFFSSILAQSLYTDVTEGLAFAMSSRDLPPANAGPLGWRLDRNVRNQIEGLILFTPLVVAVELQGASGAATQVSAMVYAASRVVYPFCYVLGLNPWRTLVWTVGFTALPVMAWGLLQA
jgi:uncharacterized MAPEG superfamily protein